jgi:signal transduction histidine kinase
MIDSVRTLVMVDDHAGFRSSVRELLELDAFEVVGQAVTNVTRHASASTLTITAEHDGSRVMVCVVDDGIGDGTRVESAPGGGTSVIGELPCES